MRNPAATPPSRSATFPLASKTELQSGPATPGSSAMLPSNSKLLVSCTANTAITNAIATAETSSIPAVSFVAGSQPEIVKRLDRCGFVPNSLRTYPSSPYFAPGSRLRQLQCYVYNLGKSCFVSIVSEQPVNRAQENARNCVRKPSLCPYRNIGGSMAPDRTGLIRESGAWDSPKRRFDARREDRVRPSVWPSPERPPFLPSKLRRARLHRSTQ